METKYGGTVTNVKRKRVPGGGSSYSKTTRAKECAHVIIFAISLDVQNLTRISSTIPYEM